MEAQPLWRKGKDVLAGVLVVASLSLMLCALLWPTWLMQNSLAGPVTMNISYCQDCRGMLKNWSWQCFKHLHCELLESDSFCDVYARSLKAMIIYCSMDFLAVVFNIMLLQRFLAYLLDRDYGAPKMMYILAVLVFVAHMTALVAYFSLTRASFTEICNSRLSPGDSPQLCVQEGIIISISAGVAQAFMVVLVCYSFWKRKKTRDVGVWICSPRVYCFSIKVWMRVIFVLHLIVYFFALLGLLSQKWVSRSSQAEPWGGGLLGCDNCPFNSEITVTVTQGWDCITGWMCNFDTASGQCKLFKRLREAGRSVSVTQFFIMELLAIVLMLQWTEVVVMLVHGREFGFPRINSLLPAGVFIVHFFAIMYWFRETRAAIGSSSCNESMDDNSDTPQVCATIGPGLAIANCAVIGLTALLFVVIYSKRGTDYLKFRQVREAEMMKLQRQESGNTDEALPNRI